jgi:hypothetical protein
MIHNDLWVNQWRTLALECKTPVVADDARFANEFATIHGSSDTPCVAFTSTRANRPAMRVTTSGCAASNACRHVESCPLLMPRATAIGATVSK